jgi:hypothetical protein
MVRNTEIFAKFRETEVAKDDSKTGHYSSLPRIQSRPCSSVHVLEDNDTSWTIFGLSDEASRNNTVQYLLYCIRFGGRRTDHSSMTV